MVKKIDIALSHGIINCKVAVIPYFNIFYSRVAGCGIIVIPAVHIRRHNGIITL